MRLSRRYLVALGVAAVALSGCSSLLGSSAKGPATTVKYTPSKSAPAKKPNTSSLDLTLPKTAVPALAPAQLTVPLSSFDLGSKSTEHPLEFHNAGDLPLTWTGTTSAPWLTISPTSGTISGNSSAVVTVTLNRLAHAGPFTTVITITSSGGTQTVQVTGT